MSAPDPAELIEILHMLKEAARGEGKLVYADAMEWAAETIERLTGDNQ